MKYLFNIILLFLIISAGSLKAQIYVSPNGNDTNSGTLDFPLESISTAISKAQAGDTIYLRGGIYSLTAKISISKSGNVNSRYHLFAYNEEKPILDFSSMAVNNSNRGINLDGSYWYLKGIEIKGAGDNGMYISGSYNKIEFCAFYENRDTGLQLGSGASNNQIINCDSYFNVDPSQGNADGFSPKLDVGTNNYFYGCRAWQNADDGWDGYMRGANDVSTTLENCWCFMNGYLKNGTASTGNGNGYKMGGSDDKTLMHNFTLKNCLAFDNRVKGFDQNNNKGSMTLYNCTGYRNGTNYSIPSTLNSGKTATIINAVALGNYGSLGSFVVQQTNSWQGFTVSNADFMSVDTAGISGPRNADGSLPSTNFLHLANGSDLVDAGTNVGILYNSTAPDLGYFESPYSAVPVELVTFTATTKKESVFLNWRTATEVNNYGFEVERSQTSNVKSETWEKIGFVTGNGNSNSPKDYSFVDKSTKQSSSYSYRLKQIDADGKFEYSNEVTVKIETPITLSLSQNYPNPFNPTTRINYQLPLDSKVTLELYSIFGERITTIINDELSAGYYTVDVNASALNLASGVYIYKMTAQNQTIQNFVQVKKLMLTK